MRRNFCDWCGADCTGLSVEDSIFITKLTMVAGKPDCVPSDLCEACANALRDAIGKTAEGRKTVVGTGAQSARGR